MGKNGKQICAVMLPTWSTPHEPEKTQSVAWPCGVFVDRFYNKLGPGTIYYSKDQRRNLPASSLPSPVSHWSKFTPLVGNSSF